MNPIKRHTMDTYSSMAVDQSPWPRAWASLYSGSKCEWRQPEASKGTPAMQKNVTEILEWTKIRKLGGTKFTSLFQGKIIKRF